MAEVRKVTDLPNANMAGTDSAVVSTIYGGVSKLGKSYFWAASETVENLNEALAPGIFRSEPGTTLNHPSGMGDSVLEVTRVYTQIIHQRLTATDGNRIMQRCKINGTWHPWYLYTGTMWTAPTT